jgi:hypothetical protein
MGLAFGVAQDDLKLKSNIAFGRPLRNKIESLLREAARA